MQPNFWVVPKKFPLIKKEFCLIISTSWHKKKVWLPSSEQKFVVVYTKFWLF